MSQSSPARRDDASPLARLTPQERAVFEVLASHRGRVVSRAELARGAGIADLNPRRCDSLIVGIRRALEHETVLTVRRRGWMLTSEPN